MERYNSNRNVIHLCRFHVVWCPKYRRPVLKPPVDRTLMMILKNVAKDTRSKIIEMQVLPDHVHILVECDPQFGIHRLIKRMKGRSSHDLRQRYPWLRSRLPTLWTNSYFVATVGSVSLETVKKYIEDQKGV